MATRPKIDQIDWSTFNLNMKTAANGGVITLTNTDQDLASSGVSISFTVSSACNAFVTVSLGVSSTTDFEFRPEIRLAGSQVSIFSPSAAATSTGRASGRTFSAHVPLSAGVNVLSAGAFISSATSPSIAIGGAVISALVLGNVTA